MSFVFLTILRSLFLTGFAILLNFFCWLIAGSEGSSESIRFKDAFRKFLSFMVVRPVSILSEKMIRSWSIIETLATNVLRSRHFKDNEAFYQHRRSLLTLFNCFYLNNWLKAILDLQMSNITSISSCLTCFWPHHLKNKKQTAF